MEVKIVKLWTNESHPSFSGAVRRCGGVSTIPSRMFQGRRRHLTP